ncbi:hypothetical protein [Burkholderia sp. BDU5]|uniref:hypothetical protein n=1 Tax=Burkholderia sp. BDU5 TaxID=1385590 RepID=UPI0012E3E4FE|nr:hypothetical protein [Burkholderia sp. BDU5]
MRNSTPIVLIARAMPRGIVYARPQAPPAVLAGGKRLETIIRYTIAHRNIRKYFQISCEYFCL